MVRGPQVEPSLAQLSEQERAHLVGLAADAVRRITETLTGHPAFGVPEGGPKSGDVDDERSRRTDALRRVRAGRAAQALLSEVVAEHTAENAADAVWLGASLADLGESIGSTRQAARKRWPDLGRIYRIRRWVSGHADDLVTVLRMVRDQATGYAAPAGSADALDAALAALDHALRGVLRDSDSRSVLDPETGRPARWLRLADAVDVRLRTVVDLATPTTPEADTALAAARGVLAHYAEATAEPATE
ncbi:hypothetical protein I0C86_03065 [Plantactinospora sp. S1510]|uniref:DUF222 domain-containing protein n=1 Tax=Plantactinospora alkalitolerans TaxID=2789879 RepID=A0ABS0GP64_9ACTN|nr:hypothetical protein [Plantactinospora alkalitolerans]MBF9127982.1 hypothetical protein [Plantactinospora alkalitolerans]